MANFDKDLVKKRFAEHLSDYDRLSVVQRNICAHLSDVLSEEIKELQLPSGVCYEVGAGTGFLTNYMLKNYPNKKWYINDLVAATEPFIASIVEELGGRDVVYQWGDAESEMPTEKIALLVSSSAMQWFNSIEEYLSKVSPLIVSGGVVAFTIYGKENFREVRAASGGVGLDYPDVSDVVRWGENSQLELIISEDYTEEVRFNEPSDVLNYIKQSGMNGNGARKWTRQDFELFCQRYNESFRDDKGVPLTFNPLLFVFRKR